MNSYTNILIFSDLTVDSPVFADIKNLEGELTEEFFKKWEDPTYYLARKELFSDTIFEHFKCLSGPSCFELVCF